MTIPTEYLALHRTCYANHGVSMESVACGCFNCITVFNGRDIKNTKTEKYGVHTALCPNCGNNTVLPGVEDKEILKSMNLYFLTPINQKQ